MQIQYFLRNRRAKSDAFRALKTNQLAAGGQHSWSEIAEEVGVSRQTVYRVLRPNKAKEHREADMTRYYKGKGKTPSPAKTSEEAKKATMKGAQKRKSD